MKNELKRLIITISIAFILIAATIYFWNNPHNWGFETKSFFLGLLIPVIILIIIELSTYDNIFFLIKTQLINRNEEVRITTAYLFKIKYDNDKYLLIRKNNKYFPIGGKFKFYEAANTEWSNAKIQVKNDYMFDHSEKRKDDLVKIIYKKDIPSFINWFKSRKNREVCLWREFYDELVKTGLFPLDLFPFIHCRYITSNPLEIILNNKRKPELKLHEIYELVLNKEQKQFLKTLYDNHDDRIYWATENEINNLKVHNSEIEFADHSPFLILN